MLRLPKIIELVRKHKIVSMKWSAGCSLLQNALDKALSYLLFKIFCKQIKKDGFRPHDTPPLWYARLEYFTKRVFSAASKKTFDID